MVLCDSDADLVLSAFLYHFIHAARAVALEVEGHVLVSQRAQLPGDLCLKAALHETAHLSRAAPRCGQCRHDAAPGPG